MENDKGVIFLEGDIVSFKSGRAVFLGEVLSFYKDNAKVAYRLKYHPKNGLHEYAPGHFSYIHVDDLELSHKSILDNLYDGHSL